MLKIKTSLIRKSFEVINCRICLIFINHLLMNFFERLSDMFRRFALPGNLRIDDEQNDQRLFPKQMQGGLC